MSAAHDFKARLAVAEAPGFSLIRPDAELPRRFGRHLLLRRLGAGGMAEIFLALYRSRAGFEKLFVVKRILPRLERDSAFVEMLLREARIAATLSHPHIAQVFDVGYAEGSWFMAMEHVHGEDLRSIVQAMARRGVARFPLEHALTIAIQVAAALHYAHEKRDIHGRELGIVHRDVSPQNIVVSYSGVAKLVDFGIAETKRFERCTRHDEAAGKAAYMSPEQATGAQLDGRSDVFALGIVLFELTTGKRLFRGATEAETLEMIVRRDCPPPSTVVRAYPAELERIVLRALARDPDERYASARELQRDLEAFVRDARVAASPVGLARFMEDLFDDKLADEGATLPDLVRTAYGLACDRAADEVMPHRVAALLAAAREGAARPWRTRDLAARARRYVKPALALGACACALALSAREDRALEARPSFVAGAAHFATGGLALATYGAQLRDERRESRSSDVRCSMGGDANSRIFSGVASHADDFARCLVGARAHMNCDDAAARVCRLEEPGAEPAVATADPASVFGAFGE